VGLFSLVGRVKAALEIVAPESDVTGRAAVKTAV
jgi:hypothetical protein